MKTINRVNNSIIVSINIFNNIKSKVSKGLKKGLSKEYERLNSEFMNKLEKLLLNIEKSKSIQKRSDLESISLVELKDKQRMEIFFKHSFLKIGLEFNGLTLKLHFLPKLKEDGSWDMRFKRTFINILKDFMDNDVLLMRSKTAIHLKNIESLEEIKNWIKEEQHE